MDTEASLIPPNEPKAKNVKKKLGEQLALALQANLRDDELLALVDALNKKATSISDALVLYYDKTSNTGYTVSELLNAQASGSPIKGKLEKVDVADLIWGDSPPQVMVKKSQKPMDIVNAYVSDYRINTRLKKVHYPIMKEEVEFTTKLTKVATKELLLEKKGTSVVFLVPFPELGTTTKHAITYTPRYATGVYDDQLYKMCRALEMPKLLKDLDQVLKEWYLGDGTPEGQMGRFVACLEVSRRVKGKLLGIKPDSTQATDDRYLATAKRPWPEGWSDKLITMMGLAPPLDITITDEPIVPQLRALDEIGKPMVTINRLAVPGVLYPTYTREQTILNDLQMLQIMINLAIERPEEVLTLIEQNPWMNTVFMKNKFEISEKAKVRSKTRNIFPSNSIVNVFNQIIHNMATHASVGNAQNDFTRSSLLGFNPARGNFEEFILKLLKVKEWTAAYADNLYRVEGNFWHSMDGAKFEASHNKDTADGLYEAYKKILKGSIPESFVLLLDALGRDLSFDQNAVFYSAQFMLPGLASGAIATADFNTVLMLLVIHHAKDIGSFLERKDDKTFKFTQSFDAVLEKCGVELTHESWVDLEEVRRAALDNMGPKLRQFLFDLLGWDLTIFHGFGQTFYLPTIARPRLLRAALFMKVSKTVKGLDLKTALLTFQKLKTLYLTGAWAHADLSRLIVARMRAMMDSFAGTDLHASEVAHRVELVNFLTAEMDEYLHEGGMGEILDAALEPTVPTPYTVLAVFAPPIKVRAFVGWVFEHHADTWEQYLPPFLPDEYASLAPPSIRESMSEIKVGKVLAKLSFLSRVVGVQPHILNPEEESPWQSTRAERTSQTPPDARPIKPRSTRHVPDADMKKLKVTKDSLINIGFKMKKAIPLAISTIKGVADEEEIPDKDKISIARANLNRWLSSRTGVPYKSVVAYRRD